jgi:hypothetical protein
MRDVWMMQLSCGRLTVISGPHAEDKYLCCCKCGLEKLVWGMDLRRGHAKVCNSCAQKKRESSSNLLFLFSHLPEWLLRKLERTVENARNRCNNPLTPRYDRWEGRGIQVKFRNDEEFFRHLLSLEGHDDPKLTLDRVNNDGHCEPGNLRFTSMKEQVYDQGIMGTRHRSEQGFDVCFKRLHDGGVSCTEMARLYCTNHTLVRECILRLEDLFGDP